MPATLHRNGTYSETPSHFTPEQRWEYISGRQQDAHIRRWYAEQRRVASAHITTESLLDAIRGPKRTPASIKARCQALRDEALNNPLYTPQDYVRMCKFADKQEAKELAELRQQAAE